MRGNFDVLSGLKAGLKTSLPSVTLLFLGLFLSSVLGLCWAVQAFSSGEQGCSPVALLAVLASLDVAHGLQGTWAQ